MNLKKIVGSTVDRLTLSYTEKHMKEALEQEHVIPTPILSVIAEKSFNDYNMKSISSFIDKSFKMDFKEWRKFRNLLKIIEYLLKFGSNEFVALARQHSSDIRGLQNYSFSEGGTDRGAAIRESALLILQLLNNARDLDYIREESKRHRDRFTGISSNPGESTGYSGSSAYSGYGNSSYSGNSYNAPGLAFEPKRNYESQSFDFKDTRSRTEGLIFTESQKKLAQSIFGTQGEYKGPELKTDLFQGTVRRDDDRREGSQRVDLFNQPTRVPESQVRVDLFNQPTRVPESQVRVDLFNQPTRSPESQQRVDLFNQPTRSPESRQQVDLFQQNSRDIFATSKPSQPYSALFSADSAKKPPSSSPLFEAAQHRDVFQHDPVPSKPSLPLFSPPGDLFSQMTSPNDTRAPVNPSKTVDLFAGVNRKDSKARPEETSAVPTSQVLQARPDRGPGYNLFEVPAKPAQIDLFAVPGQPVEDLLTDKSGSKTSDLFASTTLKVTQASQAVHSVHPVQSPDLFSFPEGPKASDPGFVLQPKPVASASSPNNLFGDLPVNQGSSNSMFAGMVQKRGIEPSASSSGQNFPLFGLDGLDLTPSNTVGSSNSFPNPAKPGAKVRSNLIQSDCKPEPVKKAFNPSEFEEKLFSLDFK